MSHADDLHVVVFTDTFFETNGVGSYYKTLLNWSKRVGHMRMTVICPARDDTLVGKVPEDVIPVRGLIQFRNPFYKDLTLGTFSESKLRAIINSLPGSKVIHIATSGALGVAGANAARHLKLPLVGCYNTDLQHYGRIYGESVGGRPGRWLGGKAALLCDKLAYGRCQAMCVPSATARDSVMRFFHKRVEVVPYPVDVERFRPAADRSGDFRERYCPNGAVLAAIIGRIAKEKNLDLICELLGRDERIKLIFVGDGPYAKSLKARWNAQITGFLSGQALLDAYQQADVFVQLSVTETFGLSLMEALACGLPAMILKANGLADVIPEGRGVEILDRNDLPTLADRCVSLASDADQHRERARRVRDFAMTLGAESVLPKFEAFHREYAR